MAFFTPWAIAMIVHQYQVILSLACIFAALFAIPLTLTNSAILYLQTLLDAGLYETNFRLSLKQMYDGDRLAICPITIPSPTPRHKDFIDNETTQASSCGWQELPTTRLLQKSRQTHSDILSESSVSSDSAADSSFISTTGRHLDYNDGNQSDFSELLVATEQAQNPITSSKLLKAYNEQGHYSVRQSLNKLSPCCRISTMLQSVVLKLIWLAAFAFFVLNCAVLYSWLYHDDSDLEQNIR